MIDATLIAQGAEARIYKGSYLGRTVLMKERFVKKYRHPELDSLLTRDRIKNEVRAILRAKAAGITTPAIFLIDIDKNTFYMEFIDNARHLNDFIKQEVMASQNKNQLIDFVCRELGILIAKLHMKSLIHGDLTTSNILIKDACKDPNAWNSDKNSTNFCLIDFGLARLDSTAEDKAVDLYVFERSLLSTHPEVPDLFQCFFEYYQKYYTNIPEKKEIIAKYKEVMSRGRKRLMIG